MSRTYMYILSMACVANMAWPIFRLFARNITYDVLIGCGRSGYWQLGTAPPLLSCNHTKPCTYIYMYVHALKLTSLRAVLSLTKVHMEASRWVAWACERVVRRQHHHHYYVKIITVIIIMGSWGALSQVSRRRVHFIIKLKTANFKSRNINIH